MSSFLKDMHLQSPGSLRAFPALKLSAQTCFASEGAATGAAPAISDKNIQLSPETEDGGAPGANPVCNSFTAHCLTEEQDS